MAVHFIILREFYVRFVSWFCEGELQGVFVGCCFGPWQTPHVSVWHQIFECYFQKIQYFIIFVRFWVCVAERSSFVALNVFRKWHWNVDRMMISFGYGWSEYDELSLKCGIKLELHNLEFSLEIFTILNSFAIHVFQELQICVKWDGVSIYIFLAADKLFRTRSEPCFWVMLVGAVHCRKLLASAFLATQLLDLRV